MNEIIINDTPVTIKEYQGQRVVTLKDIDTVHSRADGTARRNFNTNKKYFIEGEDYFKITPYEFRTAIGEMDSRQQNDVTLITESGYLMLVKSFTDDLAWNVQRQLVKIYFRAKAKSDSYLIDDPIERAKRWIEEQEAKRELETIIAVQNQQIAELQPKAS
ncbi:MAG: ORF6N domain-containing protein [Oscillospiraceae bacterium]